MELLKKTPKAFYSIKTSIMNFIGTIYLSWLFHHVTCHMLSFCWQVVDNTLQIMIISLLMTLQRMRWAEHSAVCRLYYVHIDRALLRQVSPHSRSELYGSDYVGFFLCKYMMCLTPKANCISFSSMKRAGRPCQRKQTGRVQNSQKCLSV
jgi:hypothetical protein